jgi:bifunctional oligoribonuclease and PAP phosphatase NrnA
MTTEKLWFKAKRYGWGWYPVSYEGWIVMLIYLLLVVFFFVTIDAFTHSASDTLIGFSLPFIGITCFFLSICYVKGEAPHWRWGYTGPSGKLWRKIRKADRILLHCHPSPDPDSVGSVLAMKWALESKGKKVTVIAGDSEIPPAFMHFPGAAEIVKKNFSEVDLKDFDLFISLDSSTPEMISRKNPPVFPLSIPTIVIDHHASNKGYADDNFIDISSPSVTYILFKLFRDWNIEITEEMAANLFIGMYTDTGGFRFPPTDHKVLRAAAELACIYPLYTTLIFTMENSQEKDAIYGQALALGSIKTYHNDKLVISAVSHAAISEKNISSSAISEGYIANILKSVVGWDVAASMVEIEPGKVKVSFRTRDVSKYDLATLATSLGGGGHKAASGVVFTTSLDEAVGKVVETVKVLYNL